MPFQLPMKYAHTAVSALPSAGQPENNMSERAQAPKFRSELVSFELLANALQAPQSGSG
jgi:hypothetical protein